MNFLLEIGTEEIPHWMIPGALEQLSKLDLLGAAPLVDATPRRLVVKGGGVPERTPDEEQIVKGPPLSAGEKAAAGFAKKQGVDLAAMQKAGDYWELHKTVPGRAAIDIFAEMLPGAIVGIQWPKTMYWTEKSGPRFIRPIRWIVALLGDRVIPFEIAGVKSGNITRGHRQLGSASIPVTIESYDAELRKNFVILSSHERRHKIEKEASALGAKIDRDLLETLTFITEFPTAIRGEFDPKYLELPAEVLTTVMRHHQKYFSVESKPGQLAPNFVAVMNTAGDPEGLVKHGNERVLKARFNDARFFWDVDQQRPLRERVDDLKKVVFHAKLGTYFEKTERMVAIVRELNGGADAQSAARLAKTDLTTEMVKEFTELQGIVGGMYAQAQGERPSVAKAIYCHYMPESMDHETPYTREGQIVSIADKLDTLRSCFKAGMIPSGSKDPFALRRAAQGIVKILVERDLPYSLFALCEGDAKLVEFFIERVRFYFRDHLGLPYDEVNAAMGAFISETGWSNVVDLKARLMRIHKIRATDDFEHLSVNFKRMKNILVQANNHFSGLGPKYDLFTTEYERDLHHTFLAVGARPMEEAIVGLSPKIRAFFDNVMVNDSNPEIRENRLELVRVIYQQLHQIADFSEIVTAGEQK
jgi:glycyl-tRNA synthetase beta chain